MMSDEIGRIVGNKDLSDELKKLLLEDHLKRQSESRLETKPALRGILANGPVLAVIASVTAALVSGAFAYNSSRNENAATQLLERQKFEYELVKTALSEQKLPEDRKKTLAFFKSIGLFQLLRIADVQVSDIPAIGVTTQTLFTIENLYPETAATIGLILSESRISADNKTWKKFWHLYRVDLIGVESQAVAGAMVAFGRELTRLAEAGAGPSDELRKLGKAVVAAMAQEVPAIEKFLVKMSD